MILPKQRDSRFITIRRGGTLQDSDHHLLALWAADCAEHVLYLFENVCPQDDRPRQAIESARAWTRGEISMSQSRAAGGHAMAAARALSGAARHAAFAAGQAGVVAHVAAMSWEPPPMPSKPSKQRHWKVNQKKRGDWNVSGNEHSFRFKSAHWCWMIRNCVMKFVGSCLIAENVYCRSAG